MLSHPTADNPKQNHELTLNEILNLRWEFHATFHGDKLFGKMVFALLGTAVALGLVMAVRGGSARSHIEDTHKSRRARNIYRSRLRSGDAAVLACLQYKFGDTFLKHQCISVCLR